MSIRRWNPMRDIASFKEFVNRIYDAACSRRFGALVEGRPAVDMVDKGENYVEWADLPECGPEKSKSPFRTTMF